MQSAAISIMPATRSFLAHKIGTNRRTICLVVTFVFDHYRLTAHVYPHPITSTRNRIRSWDVIALPLQCASPSISSNSC